jgi:hypothetical protein
LNIFEFLVFVLGGPTRQRLSLPFHYQLAPPATGSHLSPLSLSFLPFKATCVAAHPAPSQSCRCRLCFDPSAAPRSSALPSLFSFPRCCPELCVSPRLRAHASTGPQHHRRRAPFRTITRRSSEPLPSWSPRHPYLFQPVPNLELLSTTSFRAAMAEAQAQPMSKLQPEPSSSAPEHRRPRLPRHTGENPPLLSLLPLRRSAAGPDVAHGV